MMTLRELSGDMIVVSDAGVPFDAWIGDVETAPTGKTHFERGKRLVAVVAKAIVGVDVNCRLRIGRELDVDFLFVDRHSRDRARQCSR